MPFDLSTAKPVNQQGNFDLSTAQPVTQSWGETLSSAGRQILPSVGHMIGGAVESVMHPVQTAENLGKLVVGTGESLTGKIAKMIDPSLESKPLEAEQMANQVGQYYKNKYGSEEGFKQALATDPAGVLADASIALTGGASALTKAGLLPRTARLATEAGQAINPLNLVTKAVTKPIKAAFEKPQQALDLQAAQNATRDATLRNAHDAGYRVDPSTINPTILNKVLTGVGGKASTQQILSAHNQEITNTLAKKSLGLPQDIALSDKVLNEYRDSVAQPYREVANLPKKESISASRIIGETGKPLIAAKKGFDPRQALEKLKQARSDSKDQWNYYNRSAKPSAKVKAMALDEKVTKLENKLESYAKKNGSEDLLQRLKDSRIKIAKSYTIQKALNDATGNVSSAALARAPYLTGDLKSAADFAKAYPKFNQRPEAIGAMPGISPLDFTSAELMGGMGAEMAGAKGLLAAGIPLARPLVRALNTSEMYQKRAAKPRYEQRRVVKGSNRLSQAMKEGFGTKANLAYQAQQPKQ